MQRAELIEELNWFNGEPSREVIAISYDPNGNPKARYFDIDNVCIVEGYNKIFLVLKESDWKFEKEV